MDAVNKGNTVSNDASTEETSILEISTNNQDDTLNYQTADEENSSKYFSIIADSTLQSPSSTDVTLEGKSIINDSLSDKVQILNNLTNIQNKSVDKLQIHEKIDAAKILSGGVDIFDDNENSSDEHGLVIDYDAQGADSGVSADMKKGEAVKEPMSQVDLSKELDESKNDSSKSDVEEKNIKSSEEKQLPKSADEELSIAEEIEEAKEVVAEQDVEKTDNYSALLQSNLPEGSSEVTLLIDDKNVDAIDIGEGVFIYKNDDGELTAIQITMNEDGTTNIKCLHVGKNEDGNLEVYEEQVSQVPVTTEELESMRSQELAKASSTTPITTTSDTNCKDSKGQSGLKKETIKDTVVTSQVEDIKLKHEPSQDFSIEDQTASVTVATTEVMKSSQISTITVKGNLEKETLTSETDIVQVYTSQKESNNEEIVVTSEKIPRVEKDISKEVNDIVTESLIDAKMSTVNTLSEESNVLPIEEKAVSSEDKHALSDDTKLPTSIPEIKGLINAEFKTLTTECQHDSTQESSSPSGIVQETEKSLVLSSNIKQSKPFLQEDTAVISSPVNVCGVSTKISDPVLPAEFISDSQDSTSNILSAMNNEESSNTVESVVSSCPSINPTDSIMSEQLSINDTLCGKLNENNKILTFEMSNLQFKGESTQSASLSEDVSQGESISKSISDDEISNDSNLQPLVIEDNSISHDSISESLEVQKEIVPKSIDLPATVPTNMEANISKESLDKTAVPGCDTKSIDESAESQTSMESDDDDYVVGEPVTGDSGVEWNSGVEKQPVIDITVKTSPDIEDSTVKNSETEIVAKEKENNVTKGLDVNLSDNNNDVIKTTLSEKKTPDKSKETSEIVIKEVDFDKFVRRNSLQMFEECIQVDFEDVTETIKTKTVPVLELEYKSVALESAAKNTHIVTHEIQEDVMKAHHTSSVVSKTSRSLDESVTYLSNVAEKSPSPKKNLVAHRPTYSPVENNKYMDKAHYSTFSNQNPKNYLPNKVSPVPQPHIGVRKQDPINVKPRTYMPVHKNISQSTSPTTQNPEKTLTFGVLNEKQSPTISPTQQVSLNVFNSAIVSSPDTSSQDSKQCSIGTQVEKSMEGTCNKSNTEVEITEAQKIKQRQPRKQVFTPVTRSDMEIIFPNLYNNAQEHEKKTDAKALKLKKEQDLKFKQLSKKEQSKRAEKNKVQNKLPERIISPVKSIDKNTARGSPLLSTPVKSFDRTAIKDTSETSPPVKIIDKPIVKDPPHLTSPIKSSEKIPQPFRLISTGMTSNDVPHLSSPVKSFGLTNVNESHGVTSPVKDVVPKNIDKTRDQLIQRSSPVKNSEQVTICESSYLSSPVKSSLHNIIPEKNKEKSYPIDLPISNIGKTTTCSSKVNSHVVDNSRLNVSPRTYSRFVNKPQMQNVYNLSLNEPVRQVKSMESFPKISEIIGKKILENSDNLMSQAKSMTASEQIGVTTNFETNIHVENIKTNVVLSKNTHNQSPKEIVKTSFSSDSQTMNVSGKNVAESIIDEFVTSPVPNNKKELLPIVKPEELNKPQESTSHSSPVSSKKIVEKKSLEGTTDSISTPEIECSIKNSDKHENNNPMTESAKRKRGRPKKISADSPISVKLTQAESPVRNVDIISRKKLTPKDSPKLEEKSRASSISPFGKIDENIKCPICFKTFRTHNVLIKHVKHCNGAIDAVETHKIHKKRKFTDSLKSEDSMESEKSEMEKEKENDSKIEDPVTISLLNKDSDNSKVSLSKKLKVVTYESTEKTDDVSVTKDSGSKKTPDNDKSKDKILEIGLADSVITESDSSKVREIPVRESNKRKSEESLDLYKNDAKKIKPSVGRPTKDKSIELTKQQLVNKQPVVASPMSRLAKIKNTKPPSNSPIACNVCGKTFRQLAHMVYHRSSKHNVEETDMPVDSISMDVVKSKPEVVETPLEVDAILKCEICHKGFRKLHHLVEHREVHANNETKSRRTSVASVKSEPEPGFRCDTCDKSFRKLHHLVEHKELHQTEVTEPSGVPVTPTKVSEIKPAEDATCPGCGKSFRKRHHMVEHRDVHCSPSKPKGKPDDGSSVSDVNIRLSTASSASDEGNNCGICGKSYRKLHHMVEHRESHAEVREEKAKNKAVEPEHLSTKDIIHECSRCYMVFPNENSLNKHVDICSKKRFVKKPLNFNSLGDENVANIVSQPSEKLKSEKSSVPIVEEFVKLADEDSNNDVVIIESTEETPKLQQPNAETPVSVCNTDKPTISVSSDVSKNIYVPRESSDSKDSQKPEKKTLVVPKVQNVRKSTLTKDTISSKFRKSLVTKHSSISSDDLSVVSRASSIRKSSISSESVSSRISIKRKSSSSMECLPPKKSNTKDSSITKPAMQRKSLDSISKKITKVPNRRSLQQDAGDKDDDSNVKYKLNDNNESDIKYKLSPGFSKSIKRLSQSSVDTKITKTAVMKAKTRRSESVLSGLILPKEQTLQTIMEETNVRYSFPKNSKSKTVEPNKPTSSREPSSKKLTAVKQSSITGKKVVVTKKTNIVVANRRKSLGGRKSIDTKKLPGVKKLQLRCCSQVFNSQAELAVHRKTHKEHQKVHKCDCGKVFDTEGLLKRHMDIEHTPPKSYKCTVCGASVRTAIQFAKHKRDHDMQHKSQKPSAGKKPAEAVEITKAAKQTKCNKSGVKTEVPKSVKVQAGKSKSPVAETRKGVKRKVAHGGVPLSDKMRKAMAGAKF